ncbi:MAG: electron transport complex protein RnfA, partial [Bacilli bacterium]
MSLTEMISFAISAMLIQNIVLSQFLGLCSFFGVSAKQSSAVGMGLSVLFVISVSSIVSYAIYYLILVPNDMKVLQTLVFILVISSLVQVLEMFIKKISPILYKALGIYLPLITTNCAVLGVALLNIENQFNVTQMLLFSVFTSMGYTIA